MSLFVCVCVSHRFQFWANWINSLSLTFHLTETSLQKAIKDESRVSLFGWRSAGMDWISRMWHLFVDHRCRSWAQNRDGNGMALALLTCFGSHKWKDSQIICFFVFLGSWFRRKVDWMILCHRSSVPTLKFLMWFARFVPKRTLERLGFEFRESIEITYLTRFKSSKIIFSEMSCISGSQNVEAGLCSRMNALMEANPGYKLPGYSLPSKHGSGGRRWS